MKAKPDIIALPQGKLSCRRGIWMGVVRSIVKCNKLTILFSSAEKTANFKRRYSYICKREKGKGERKQQKTQT